MTETTSLYPYSPSIALAIIFTIIFLILLGLHLWRLFATRSWFCLPFVIGALFEAVGYAARAYGHSSPGAKTLYIIQSLTILVAPILFAASAYMFLGRIVIITNHASLSLIRPSLLTKVFVGGDVLCFLVQAMGGTIMLNADTVSGVNIGKYTILGGLLLQLAIFGFFLAVAVVFEIRMGKIGQSTAAAGALGGAPETSNWRRYMHMLYVVSVLITVRNVFRVAEYTGGKDGYLLSTEWPLYVFDALFMAAVLGVAVTWYIGEIVVRFSRALNEEDYINMDEENNRRTAVPSKVPQSGWTASRQ